MEGQLFIFKGRTVRVVRHHLQPGGRKEFTFLDVEDVDTADRFENVPRWQLQAVGKTPIRRPN